VPKLLIDLRLHDLALVVVLIVAAFAARLAVLFLLLPMLSFARLTQPISEAYKLAIAWGGLGGALTLVLALSVTEHPALPHEVKRFVAVLATGLVLFTLLVNGTTLRAVIHFLGLDRTNECRGTLPSWEDRPAPGRHGISLRGPNLRDDLLEGLSRDPKVAAERVVERDDHDQGFIEGRVGSGTVV
jgi:hypothetical protein